MLNYHGLNIGFGYDKVVLIPNKGILDTRNNADTSCEFLGKRYKLPICPSNMKCVIDFKLAEWLSNNGYFYILHRFYDYKDIFNWVKNNQNLPLISISVGVKQKDRDLIFRICGGRLRVDVITIDISHGFSENMRSMIAYIKNIGFQGKIIAGNIFGDKDSVQSLEDWGADAIKVGLAYGRSCITKNKTGIASPMFSSGLEASKWTYLPLIGDGSVKENGDIALGLRAGYDMIMAGSIFAACENSPAEYAKDIYLVNHFTKINSRYKLYYGSASSYNGNDKNIEGRIVEIECNNMTIEEKLEEIRQDLSSTVSFLGGKDLSCIRNVEYQIVL